MEKREYLLLKINEYEKKLNGDIERKLRKKTYALLKSALVEYLELTQTEMKAQKKDIDYIPYFDDLIKYYDKLVPLCKFKEKMLVKTHMKFLEQSKKRLKEK